MLPERSLLVCTSPRSGSNWLCDIIRQTEWFGRPDEYFSSSSERFYERQLGRCAIANYPRVFDYILRLGATPNRHFSSKLFWTQCGELEDYFHRSGSFPEMDAMAILVDQLPRLSILRLSREDMLRQAISHYRALSTNVWWKHRHIPVARGADCAFDYERIRSLLLMIAEWEQAWEKRLIRMDVSQLTVTYAAMRRNLPEVLERISSFLDIPPEYMMSSATSEFQPQADTLTDAWVEHFLTIDVSRTSREIGRDLAQERPEGVRRVTTVVSVSPPTRRSVPSHSGVWRLDANGSGTPIYEVEGLVPPDACKALVACLRRNTSHFARLDPGNAFDNRILWFRSLPEEENKERMLMQETRDRTVALAGALFDLPRLPIPEHPQLVLWRMGQFQDVHADKVQPDGSPNRTPGRDIAAVLFLNDTFEGGELFFPDRDVMVRPRTGTLVMFGGGADSRHGVHPVLGGERITMPLWMKLDRQSTSAEEVA